MNNREFFKKVIQECIVEVMQENEQLPSINVAGYGSLSIDKVKKSVEDYLLKALNALESEDYDTLEYCVGENSNGVLESMVSALKNYKKENSLNNN